MPRYNRQRAVTISAAIDENYSLAEAMKFFENTLNEVAPQNQITWKGKSEELKETSNEIYIIFALALITAYLVMACLLYTSPSPRDKRQSRMPSSA